MWKLDISMQRASATLRYGVAVSSFAAALVLTLLVHPDALQSPIFFLAIILSAWIGGTGPGLLAATLSTLALSYFFLPPPFDLKLDPRYTPQLLVFFLSALLISSWSAARRGAEHKLRRTRDELEAEVHERTAQLSRSNEQLQRAVQETQALKDRLRLVVDTIPVMVWSAGPDGAADFFNQRWVEYHGPAPQGSDRECREAVNHPEEVAQTFDKWRAAVAAGEPYEHEHRVRRADGVYRWCLVRGVPLRDGKGHIVRWYGTSVDIQDRKEAEEKIRRSETELRTTLEAIPAAVVSTLPDGSVDFASQSWLDYLGSSREQLLGWSWVQVVHPEDLDELLNSWRAALAAGQPLEVETRVRRADGKYRWFVARAVPLLDENRNIIKWYSTMFDIEDRKQAEQSLRRSEAYLSGAQRLSHTGSFGWRVATEEILWSEETFRIFQYERTTKPTVELILQRAHPEDRTLIQRTIERASQEGKDFDLEHRLLMPDGSVKHVRVLGHADSDRLGEREFVGAVMDVTAAKEAEERIGQSERQLRVTLEAIPASVVSTLPDGSVDFVSQSWLDYVGSTRGADWDWKPRVHPEDLDRVVTHWQAALAVGEPLEIELRHQRADGEYRWFLTRIVPLRDETGNIVKWYSTTFDIEDRKRAEQCLQKSEAYLAEAQRLSRTGSIGWNVANGECFWSEETFRIYQVDRATPLTAETILQRTHPDDLALVRQSMESALQIGQEIDFEHRLLMPDGAVKHVHVVSHPVFNGAGDLVEYVGSVMDVTEHKQAAEALERSKNRFRAMVEKSVEGILLVLPGMEIIYASSSVERVLGYTPEEFMARPLNDHLHPDFRQRRAEQWKQLLEEPEHEGTVELLTRHKDGSWRWIESHTRNLLNEPGVQAVVVNFRDISERKHAQAERERLEQRLRQAEKMEAVGRLAGGIAHDFNNVLAGIFAYGEMLFEETPGDSPLKRYARNVLIAATRGRALVEQILAYSSSRRGKRAPVDIVHVVDETLELIRGSLPADIRLEASAPERPLVVIGDATQLHQVVTNLCSNAIQAMSGGGTLRVTLEIADLSVERALSHGTLHPGRYVRLAVEDSGSGMDETTIAHIFEPFFTTKDIGRGTGLGLSLVYAIVADSGGAIDVKSAPGRGTTITIYGLLAEVALAAADEIAVPPPRGHGERVLLIDDEAPLLAATAEVLARLGYEPVSFSDSHAALAAFEAAPERFDVVVTDEVMPGLTGTGLANVVRRHRPDLPIVLLSGYSGAILTQQALAAGVSELLVKPLQSREIAATLTRVLNRTA